MTDNEWKEYGQLLRQLERACNRLASFAGNQLTSEYKNGAKAADEAWQRLLEFKQKHADVLWPPADDD